MSTLIPQPLPITNLEHDERPWGEYTVYLKNLKGPLTVKLIKVKPGQRNSLQYHNLRAETWFVVSGKMLASIDGLDTEYSAGEAVAVPCGAHHRFTGLDEECLLIEIATGRFEEHTDNYRIEDDYGREHEYDKK